MVDANLLAALAAVASAIIAIVALYSEIRRSSFSLGVDILLRLNDRFDSSDMVETRRKVAVACLNKSWDEVDVDDVLDFFEEVGFLSRRHGIDDEVVWHEFYWRLHRYYVIAKSYIDQTRKDDPTIWEDLFHLHQRLMTIEKHKGGSDTSMELTEKQIMDFLTEESKLT